MMNFTPEFLLQVLIGAGMAVGVYVGVKTDLAVTRSKADSAISEATSAHTRIDDLYKGKFK